MMNAVLKAFTGRAGWLPSLLALAIILLIAVATVTALPRIEHSVDTQIQRYLETNLSANDSMLGVQVRGRDVLLSGRIADPELLRAGLIRLPGVRGVIIDSREPIAPSGIVDDSADGVKTEMSEPDAGEVSAAAEISGSSSPESSELSAPLPVQSDSAINNIAATSTGQAVSDDASSPSPSPSDVQAGDIIAGAGNGYSADPAGLILSLNTLFSASPMFAPGDAQISAKLSAALMSLAEMMSQNSDLVLGIETYPELGVGLDKGAYIAYLRARNTEKFLLEQQLEDARIFTRDLSNDRASAEQGLQLKLYILK